jgi:hypothetical protein
MAAKFTSAGAKKIVKAVNQVLDAPDGRRGQGSQKRSYSNREFPAKLGDNDGGTPTQYAWTEQTEDGEGDLTDKTGGRSGTTTTKFATALFESGIVNTSGTIVRMFQSFDSDGTPYFRFLPALPTATGRGKVLQIGDDLTPVGGWIVDYPGFHSGS